MGEFSFVSSKNRNHSHGLTSLFSKISTESDLPFKQVLLSGFNFDCATIIVPEETLIFEGSGIFSQSHSQAERRMGVKLEGWRGCDSQDHALSKKPFVP
jgi:hypothetical protein